MSNDPIKYLALTLDPVHIGAGGYKLGNVDNTIVREPATDVPKIPGTSLAGSIREYATIYLRENSKGNDKDYEQQVGRYFGTDKNQGMIRFYDAQIVFFPVNSIKGTVWITTKDLLDYWIQPDVQSLQDIEDEDKAYILRWDSYNKPKSNINLGWLLLDIYEGDGKYNINNLPVEVGKFVKRAVMVSDKLFSHIVNDNLEVRTSVKIDTRTGAAEEGKLFTYEAIPRGTVLAFEVYKDWRRAGDSADDAVIEEALKGAFCYIEALGIGGMGTRGFGRIKILPKDDKNTENNQPVSQGKAGESNAQS